MPLSSRLRPCFIPGIVLTGLAALAHAQTDTAPVEGNVHIEYAEVLRVEPVHVSEDACPAPPAPPAPRAALATLGRSAQNSNGTMLSLNAPRPRPSAPPATPRTGSDDTVQPETECIADGDADGEGAQRLFYDVDYILRGIKYRSRLPYDPGNRLQVQFSVTPVTSPESDPPPES